MSFEQETILGWGDSDPDPVDNEDTNPPDDVDAGKRVERVSIRDGGVLVSVKTVAFASTEPKRATAVPNQTTAQQTFYRSSIRRAWRGIARPVGRFPAQGRRFWCHRLGGFW